MLRTIQDFLDWWKSETENTLKILNNLTNESLSTRVTADGRSIGDIAWHIANTLGELAVMTGSDVKAPDETEPAPNSSQEIYDKYEQISSAITRQIQHSWTDAMLAEEIEISNIKMKRCTLIEGFILHEIHHRAQLTVLMRQAGLVVPGVYGPSKEE